MPQAHIAEQPESKQQEEVITSKITPEMNPELRKMEEAIISHVSYELHESDCVVSLEVHAFRVCLFYYFYSFKS